MKIADLYIRVSTDEQADKGYSQRDQAERLQKYCNDSNITIRKVIYEDHSAKTFIRPEWTKLLVYLRQHRNKSNLVLFTKWDRFSRNAPDAYNMISMLKSFGVEPQAIEQPLDMTVPENKMMLAIYLTAPEIENDRRGLNTFYGIRRARKEGRWPGLAPVGYINRTAEDGKKYIGPDGEQAKLMEWAFKEISKGKYSTEQIFRKAVESGLKCSKNNFLRLVRNPIYCGRIPIAQFKDEDAFTVIGLHEPIISESLFYEVQDILDGNKRTIKTKIITNKHFPLKGFICCSRCPRTLCTSGSKGRSMYYYYYHCCSECGCRYKAEDVNNELLKLFDLYTLDPRAIELFKMVILDEYANDTIGYKEYKVSLAKQLTDYNSRVSKARELLLAGDLDGIDYKGIKADCERGILITEAQIAELGKNKYAKSQLEPIIDKAIITYANLKVIYCKSDSEDKRRLIGSMFPEKITFENLKHRTAKVNESFRCIYVINRQLSVKKKGQKTFENLLPREG
ncbi:recombinase family protein [Mucilaginibacter sp. FT3.2]|uniref:recombinase family protein n=1 Tax=Mucilaginibacter sp. FT3.2 TaxID=2723090 RepID=UPI00160EB5BC|nr:recombinase family protein [Mucilaginibacter sp. FT3.2]MBB6235336.1 DNA invertase Pin-like site-specific DNA recombinase [Mucilaginibacter sp. FT3.2]